jgi:succinyl-diaminopimelate desuccinylase
MTFDVISLTRKLISYDTINPPGNEAELAEYIGGVLEEHGFAVDYPLFEKGRLHVIAEKNVESSEYPVVFSGHLDTVPLGAVKWKRDPFAGEIIDGKIYGRGSSDMKGGVAAMITAAILAFEEGSPKGGVRLIFTAGEELGCQGVNQLASSYQNLGKAKALIVGEPTANIPITGHKGGLYLKAYAKGATAHSSMPELGDNAIYKVARAISRIENFSFGAREDKLLGFPTINVGMVKGGMNLNSVPDYAEFTMDIRSTKQVSHEAILQKLQNELGDEINIEVLVNMTPVSSDEKNPFIQHIYDVCGIDQINGKFPRSLPYLTDASVLQKIYGGIPTVILGPGQPELAHQTDEYCYLNKIEEAVNIYKAIILKSR